MDFFYGIESEQIIFIRNEVFYAITTSLFPMMAILLSIFIFLNEIENKTINLVIVQGYNRSQVINSKIIFIFAFELIVMTFFLLCSYFARWVLGLDVLNSIALQKNIGTIGLLLSSLIVISYLTLLIALLAKKTGISIAIAGVIVYSMIGLENYQINLPILPTYLLTNFYSALNNIGYSLFSNIFQILFLVFCIKKVVIKYEF